MEEEASLSSNIWVIVGLGNHGKEYAQTRHNMGWMVVEELARQQGWTFKDDKRFSAYTAKGVIGRNDVRLLLPTTYMNLSGQALGKYLSYYKLSSRGVLVVADDIALDFGEVRVRTYGSSGGHNGLKSIEALLGTRHYLRVRIGIGSHLGSQRILTDYVLDAFSREEAERLPLVCKAGAEVLKKLMCETPEQVMNQVNVKKKVNQERPLPRGQENENESK